MKHRQKGTSLSQHYRIFFCIISNKGDLHKERRCLLYKISLEICQSSTVLDYSKLKCEVIFRKISSLHGIIRPPIGLPYPNSSSALLNKYTNERWVNMLQGTKMAYMFAVLALWFLFVLGSLF